jgi:hypothetical protein
MKHTAPRSGGSFALPEDASRRERRERGEVFYQKPPLKPFPSLRPLRSLRESDVRGSAAGSSSLFRVLTATLVVFALLACAPRPAEAEEEEYVPPSVRTKAEAEEFIGPLAGWANLKTDYHAVGDGKADDAPAIQKALNDLRIPGGKVRVLYIPGGTYRITQTLKVLREAHSESHGISILGADPATTILRWDGPADGNMIYYCPWYSRIGRLTLDGAGKAGTAIFHGKPFITYNEMADLVIQDVAFGIQCGERDGIAETAVLRCKFLRCSKAGISIQNFNTLDWWIWDSEFVGCHIGVSSEYHKGGGNFNVYRSVFRGSTEADITIMHTCFFGIRYNTSVGSKAFFVAKRAGNWTDKENWGATATLQGNTIVDPADGAPIRLASAGNTILLDNVVRGREGAAGPVVVQRTPVGESDMLAIGNTFTVDKPFDVQGRFIELDTKTVARDTIATPAPKLPATPQPAGRKVFEIPAGAKAPEIQKAIDEAAKLKGQRPVVHVQAGSYPLGEAGLTIPADCDVQFVGDGPNPTTRLNGTVRLAGVSHATIRDLWITRLVLDNCDQPGGRVFLEQVLASEGGNPCILVDGLDHTRVLAHDSGHSDGKVGVRVVGGPLAKAGKPAEAILAIFSGSSSNNGLSYDVADGGRILARDIWYESAGLPKTFVNLRGKGEFTLHGAQVAPLSDTLHPVMLFDDFDGRAAILGACIVWGGKDDWKTVQVRGDGSKTKVLVMGNQFQARGAFQNSSPHATVEFLHNRAAIGPLGTVPMPDEGKPDPAFLREMFQTTRTTHPQDLTPIPDDATDVRLFRVTVKELVIQAGK